jgi:hypothetical protein
MQRLRCRSRFFRAIAVQERLKVATTKKDFSSVVTTFSRFFRLALKARLVGYHFASF